MSSITYPIIPTDELIQKLSPPRGKISIVLDTDTYNEIDDQFAVVYSLLATEKINVDAFYAAPFFNSLSSSPKDGMEKSYHEILKIRKLMNRDYIPVYKGSETYLPDAETPVKSDAARDLVKRAMATDPSNPLYVVAIGAITNVASAILMEPRIIERIVVVWLGGNALHWNHTYEFNLQQDLHASRTLFDCGVPLILMPCAGVISHLHTTLSEIRDYVKPHGEIGEYLYETFLNCHDDHFAYSRVIWDISVIAWLIEPEWVPTALIHSPRISEDCRWSQDHSRHFIRCATYINRDSVFKDLFERLKKK